MAKQTYRSDADEQLLALGDEWRRLSDQVNLPGSGRSDAEVDRMTARIDELAGRVTGIEARSPRAIVMKLDMMARYIDEKYDRGQGFPDLELPDRLIVSALRDCAGLLALFRG